jgi:transcription factor C subunit 7
MIENTLTAQSEFFGHASHFEHPSPAPLSELSEDFFPELLDGSYSPHMVPTTRGETIESLHNRIAFVLHKLVESADKDPAGPKAILICTHAAVMIAAGRVLTGRMPPDVSEEDFSCYTASLSTYRRKPVGESTQVGQWNASEPGKVPTVEWREGQGVAGGWVCEKNSDASYLSGGAERGWYFDPNYHLCLLISAGDSLEMNHSFSIRMDSTIQRLKR